MRIQRDSWSCGPLAVLNALKAMGVRCSEKRVRSHTATVRGEGTTHGGIINAFERFGCSATELRYHDADEGFDFILDSVKVGHAALAYLDRDHWAAVIGAIGDRLVVFDSDNTPENKAESGVWMCDARGLKRRWKTDDAGTHYGILVTRE